MKIVMTFSKALGDCGNYMEAVPIEYESIESARTGFQSTALSAWQECTDTFSFAGKDFETFDHFHAGKLLPAYFMSVDEWFGQL